MLMIGRTTGRLGSAAILVASLSHWGTVCQIAQSDENESPRSVFPLTQQELQDESTLNETILSDVLIAGTKDSPQKLRDVRVRFFSHDWKDRPWHGTVRGDTLGTRHLIGDRQPVDCLSPWPRCLCPPAVATAVSESVEERKSPKGSETSYVITPDTVPDQCDYKQLTSLHGW